MRFAKVIAPNPLSSRKQLHPKSNTKTAGFAIIYTAVFFTFCGSTNAANTAGPQIWFSPGDDLEVGGVITHPDFPKLFEEPSKWPVGLSHIDVLQFRAPYIARKPAESAKYLSYLKAHGIAVAAVMALMPAETCDQGVEGIMSHKGIDFYPRAIKNAGVQLDYVVMDEPLYFGQDYTGKDACRLSIADVARGVAESTATIRSYHPHAKFVLSEPVALPGGPAELAEFLDAYKVAAHEYPSSVRMDVQWPKNWRSALPPFIDMLKARGIGFGIIYNATGGIHDDQSWIASAKGNSQAFAGTIRARPDQADEIGSDRQRQLEGQKWRRRAMGTGQDKDRTCLILLGLCEEG